MDDIDEKLKKAVLDQDVTAVKTLLSVGANPNQFVGSVGCKNTFLHFTDNVEIVKELLLHNAKVNEKNYFGDTPILTAITRKRKFEIIKELIESGAELKRYKCSTKLVLHHALNNSAKFEVIKELLVNGADVNAKDGNNRTALHLAFSHRYGVEVIKELLLSEPDVNARDCSNTTVLHLAIIHRYGIEIIKELLKYGVDVNALNSDGYIERTPLQLALESDVPKIEMIKELIKYGAEVHQGTHELFHNAFRLAIELNIRLAKSIIKIILIKNFDDHEKIFDLDTYTSYSVYGRLKSFLSECVFEIFKMKSVILDENNKFSLHEFLRNNFIGYNTDVSLLNNKLCMKLSNINFSMDYPIFNDFILDEVKYFLQRADYLRELSALRIYTKLDASNVNENSTEIFLDLVPMLKITEHLLNKDLLNIIKAFNESKDQIIISKCEMD